MTAFYNEKDPHAAAWLRNLIEAGEIPAGVVDERSIVDVLGDDLRGFTQCHFFAGIGVWARALRDAGWPEDRPVWTGSPPCQPLSVAGQRQGHADERHLWPAFQRLIAQFRPPVLFGEQVASADGREWFSAVRHDLESLGYACGGASLPAAGVGAPHLRYRLYWLAVADAECGRRQQLAGEGSASLFGSPGGIFEPCDDLAGAGGVADAQHVQRGPLDLDRPDGRDRQDNGRQEAHGEPRARGEVCGLVDAERAGLEGQRGHVGDGGEPRWDGEDAPRPVAETGQFGLVADASDAGRRVEREARLHGRGPRRDDDAGRGASGELADAEDGGRSCGAGLRNCGSDGERGDVAPDHGGARRSRPPDSFWSSADWIFCRDRKWRPVAPGSFPLADGSAFKLGSGGPFEGKSRTGMLRGYGNAIVLPVAIAFVEAAMGVL